MTQSEIIRKLRKELSEAFDDFKYNMNIYAIKGERMLYVKITYYHEIYELNYHYVSKDYALHINDYTVAIVRDAEEEVAIEHFINAIKNH